MSHAALFQHSEEDKERVGIQHNIEELTNQVWSSKNFMADCNPDDGKYMVSSCVYRGLDIDEEVSLLDVEYQKKRCMKDDFVA